MTIMQHTAKDIALLKMQLMHNNATEQFCYYHLKQFYKTFCYAVLSLIVLPVHKLLPCGRVSLLGIRVPEL